MAPNKDEANYDDRLVKILEGVAEDVRTIVKTTQSVTPVHERGEQRRMTPEELRGDV